MMDWCLCFSDRQAKFMTKKPCGPVVSRLNYLKNNLSMSLFLSILTSMLFFLSTSSIIIESLFFYNEGTPVVDIPGYTQ